MQRLFVVSFRYDPLLPGVRTRNGLYETVRHKNMPRQNQLWSVTQLSVQAQNPE